MATAAHIAKRLEIEKVKINYVFFESLEEDYTTILLREPNTSLRIQYKISRGIGSSLWPPRNQVRRYTTLQAGDTSDVSRERAAAIAAKTNRCNRLGLRADIINRKHVRLDHCDAFNLCQGASTPI